ncbi:MAG: bifunctional phosphoribosylaminoimidazolecarboxamide formyltransferase/IMP cyclohydrolase [Deferribacteres bacterium]|nr:bifunctional phosphoribosylaminoimidazolecarboxamide formyltransferase/IMP cyclohydrolase [Deferribacteres bacterium]
MWALISVYYKEGITEFARGLSELGYRILSTGNTAKVLRDAGIKVVDVSEYTGFPEILNGRVKTLHPKIHAGILADRKNPEHMKTLKELGIEPIDIVVVNLYPFTENPSVEMIDIGGPTMVRAAAKNYENVIIVTHAEDYSWVLERLKEKGELTLEERKDLARKAFMLTSTYDAHIYNWLEKERFGDYMLIPLKKKATLRYGENPHQKGFLYSHTPRGFSNIVQHQGKPLSFNNIYDADAAYQLILEFEDPACAIIKHTNPCGAAQGKNITEAFEKAFSCDPVSAYGGIVAFNRIVDPETAESLVKHFFEVIIAPAYSRKALEILSAKENLRAIEMPDWGHLEDINMKQVTGGFLLQTADDKLYENLDVVTKREPTPDEWEALLFGFKVVKHVKSNAIVLALKDKIVGVGAGQTSRVDSVKIAVMKAKSFGHGLEGAVMASDAFFPFPDGIEEAHKAGIKAVIQPGGSIRDKEVIETADRLGMAMVFTRMRHFKH